MTRPYLTKVEIRGFQSHKKTILHFVNGTNALVGSSNSGKSAVLRAIKWNTLNIAPPTESLVRKGDSVAFVATEWSDGHRIERERNRRGTVNYYRLFKDGTLLDEYTGFGTKVPENILAVHGMAPVGADLFINFANQLESAFLLSESPRRRAETIGNLDDLKKIDDILLDVNQDVKDVKQEQKLTNNLLKEAEARLKELDSTLKPKQQKKKLLQKLVQTLDAEFEMFHYLEQQLTSLTRIQSEIATEEQIIATATAILGQVDIEALEKDSALLEELQTASKRLREIEEKYRTITYLPESVLEQLQTTLYEVEGDIQFYYDVTKHHKRLVEIEEEYEKASSSFSEEVAALDTSPIEEDIEQYRFLAQQRARLLAIEEEIKAVDQEIQQAFVTHANLTDQLVSLFQETKMCPMCGQDTHDIHAEQIPMI